MSEEDPSISPRPPDKPPATSTSFSVVQAEASFHFGPLPSPEVLRKYQEVSPTILDEIVTAFSEQGKNRRSNETWIYKGGVVRSILGVVFAFLIGMAAILGGINLVLHGHGVEGTIFGGFGLVGLINAFLLGTKPREQKESPSS